MKEFAAHPNRPLAIRERQEGIKAALVRTQVEERANKSEALDPGTGIRKGSESSTDSGKTANSGISFGSFGSFGSRKSSKSSQQTTSSVGEFEQAKIEEGRRSYEEKQARKLQKPKEESKKGFLCFR